MLNAARKLVVVLVGALALGSVQASGDWPAKPITFIVPFTPGGITDQTSRQLAKLLSTQLGQPVVVDNRPGAGGSIGVEAGAPGA
ncbi:MAG: tripartite tricarboxylate transporter substrate binding protein, partial [Hydrogenophaga sp.]|uniref:tripartite tricarboxylate transporter substrate-binding protein n=2 Tax=Hydrogenophaga sp. TaxID=1904254 RepID=UPI001E0BD471